MLGKSRKALIILPILVAIACALAHADPTLAYERTTEARLDSKAEYKAISKVRPGSPAVTKVRPYRDLSYGFDALSKFNPVTWGPDCWLPTPAKGQFVVGPRVFFARIDGEARRGAVFTGLESTTVDFDDHLGLRKSGNAIWSIQAQYQFRPRWGITYSFTPFKLEATHYPQSGFTLMGQTFATGTQLRSSWERFEHRAGLVFNISRSANSLTKFYADWLYIQDRLTVGTGLTTPVTWDENRSMALVGLGFEKCLKNYRGNTLALSGKGGVAFFDDSLGYEAEAALSYLIPIKTGRFGFIKGGYRYVTLKKDKPGRMFGTTMDGAFVEFGFLF